MSGSTSKATGWALLHTDVPEAAQKPLSASVYGVSGLTDVNEAYLIERLHQSELAWSWTIEESTYIGKETRKSQNGTYDVFMASARGTVAIETAPGSGAFRLYSGAGASDNKKLDAAFKGAVTVAFKAALKTAGLTLSVYKNGKSVDILYTNEDGSTTTGIEGDERKSVAQKTAPAAPAEKSPLSVAQGKTLMFLLAQLPSYDAAVKLNKADSEIAPWNKIRVGDGVRANEARKTGTGFAGAFKALQKAHASECNGDCEHVSTAMQTDGYIQSIVAGTVTAPAQAAA